MKKVLLSIMVLLTAATVVSAQTMQKSRSALEKELESSNKAINNPKKSAKVATWVQRGEILTDLAGYNFRSIYEGQPESQLILTELKTPIDTRGERVNNVNYEVYVYPEIDVYIGQDGNVVFFNDKKPGEQTFAMAKESLDKAYSIDPAFRKVNEGYERLINVLLPFANNEFFRGDYDEAITDYRLIASLLGNYKGAPFTKTDIYTAIIRAQLMKKDYVAAESDIDYIIKNNLISEDGIELYWAGYVKSMLAKNDEAEAFYKRGIEEYPGNKDMLTGLIEHYSRAGESPDKVIPIVKQAQERDPNNMNLVLYEGHAYTKLGDFDKALELYDSVLAQSPDYLPALLYKSDAYLNEVDSLREKIGKVDYTNYSLRNQLEVELQDALKGAVDTLEIVYTIDPKDKNIVNALKVSSFALRDVDPIYMEKYQKYDAIYKGM